MAKVIVVGGGPSGIMAAISAAKQNHSVTLIERNEFLGKKLKLTGGGRCNITNNRYIEDFFDKVVNILRRSILGKLFVEQRADNEVCKYR